MHGSKDDLFEPFGIMALFDFCLYFCANRHYPTTKFTAVADTPENRRLAKNTKAQSQVQYKLQNYRSYK